MPTLTGWPESVATGAATSHLERMDYEVVELPLLLPRWQAAALEDAAQTRGMTTGQMLRRLIGDTLAAKPATTAGS